MLKITNKLSVNLTVSIASISLTTLAGVLPASAISLNVVTNRVDLGENDQLNWSNVGITFPPNTLTIPFNATSNSGINVNVEIPPAPSGFFPPITPPFIFQTGNAIPTNFANGDFVLFSGLQPGVFPAPGNPGPITLSFNTPVLGIGTQVAVDDAFAPFTVFLDVFDSNNQLLGSFSEVGTSSLALDNSAIFLGVISDTANISRLVYSSSVNNRAIGINQLSIVTSPPPNCLISGNNSNFLPNCANIPESSSPLTIVGLGLFLFGSTLYKPRQK